MHQLKNYWYVKKKGKKKNKYKYEVYKIVHGNQNVNTSRDIATLQTII